MTIPVKIGQIWSNENKTKVAVVHGIHASDLAKKIESSLSLEIWTITNGLSERSNDGPYMTEISFRKTFTILQYNPKYIKMKYIRNVIYRSYNTLMAKFLSSKN